MKRAASILMILLMLMVYLDGYAEESIPTMLDNAVSQAVLDGCGDLPFLVSYDEPMFEALIEAHEILQWEKQNDLYTVWLLASAAMFRENDSDGIRGNPSKVNLPIMLKLRLVDDTYILVEYNEPTGDSWSDDIRSMFPASLTEKAFAGNPTLSVSLKTLANMYFDNPTSKGPWRTSVNSNQNDPAVKAVFEKFAWFPQWEGRSILTRSRTEQLWFSLSTDGTEGYRSPCTFEKYNKDGELLSHAVVQYIGNQLVLLDGEFPTVDE